MPAINTRLKTAAATGSPKTPPTTPNATKAKLPGTPKGTNRDLIQNLGQEGNDETDWRRIVQSMEARIRQLEEDDQRLKEEVRGLRDSLEEERFARSRLEDRLKEVAAREERTEVKEVVEEVGEQDWRAELKKAEERILRKAEEEEAKRRRKRRVIVFTDSNGRNATTADSIRHHLPEETREDFEIQLDITYRVEQASDRVDSADLNVDGAYIIVDCLSNNARDTRTARALSPCELVDQVAKLRDKLWRAGAAGIVICSLKPTTRAFVASHNEAVSRYLQERREIDGGHGCCTQIRLEHLRNDGLHIQPQHFHLLQNTYACIIQGKEVPSPTPMQDFSSTHVRQRNSSSIHVSQPSNREWPDMRGPRTEIGHTRVDNGWRR